MRCIPTTCVCVYTHGNSHDWRCFHWFPMDTTNSSSIWERIMLVVETTENFQCFMLVNVVCLVKCHLLGQRKIFVPSMLSCWVPGSILNECVALYSIGQQHIQCVVIACCCCCSWVQVVLFFFVEDYVILLTIMRSRYLLSLKILSLCHPTILLLVFGRKLTIEKNPVRIPCNEQRIPARRAAFWPIWRSPMHRNLERLIVAGIVLPPKTPELVLYCTDVWRPWHVKEDFFQHHIQEGF